MFTRRGTIPVPEKNKYFSVCMHVCISRLVAIDTERKLLRSRIVDTWRSMADATHTLGSHAWILRKKEQVALRKHS